MSDKMLPVGTLVVAGRDLGVITKVGRRAGADGCWISSSTGNPGRQLLAHVQGICPMEGKD